jgi:radial spoke head protein 1
MSDDGSDIDEEKGQNLGEYEGERNEREQRHGRGKAILPNGDTYEGIYDCGQRNGMGTYRFKNGARYTGDWYKNKKHGQGLFIYPDGSKYEGSWVDDQRCGYGKFYYVNGDTYEGEWRGHVRHGFGTYIYADTGSRYVGSWKEGHRDGHGELVHANHKFVGKFKEDKPLGCGKYIFDVGCMQYGEYVSVEQPDSKGTVDEEDVKLVPVWKAKGISEIILDEHDDARTPSQLADTSHTEQADSPKPTENAPDDADEVAAAADMLPTARTMSANSEHAQPDLLPGDDTQPEDDGELFGEAEAEENPDDD